MEEVFIGGVNAASEGKNNVEEEKVYPIEWTNLELASLWEEIESENILPIEQYQLYLEWSECPIPEIACV